jgi:hypothetical protein
MSLAGKRQEFADALSTVPDVRGHAYRPGAPRAGDAWPTWGGSTIGEDNVQFTNGWQVVVYLPQDERAADDWVDAHDQALYDAIQPVAHIEGFAPANLSSTGTVYGLVIATRSE